VLGEDPGGRDRLEPFEGEIGVSQTRPAVLPFSERIVVRFGASLLANFLRVGLSFSSGLIIARGLGAAGYGDLNFLLGSFTAISQLTEIGTSSAFYTFISQRRRGYKFFAIYLTWIGLQFACTVVVVGLLLPVSLIDRIWVGHERRVVLLAFGASFLMTQVWGMVSHLGEAARQTVLVQAASVGQGIAHLVLVAAGTHWRWLTFQNVMWLLVAQYAAIGVIFGPRFVRANLAGRVDDREDARAVAKEFASYCAPLVLYGWVGFFYAFGDRWLLQQFGGAGEQGYFSIGQQFATISLLGTTSILKVFWKEVAEAKARGDSRRVNRLYRSVSRSLYFAGAWMSCLLIPYSREILRWTVGPGYEAAWLALGLMLLFPIHQSLGQIGMSFLYATGETRRYTKISLVMMGASLPVAYLMLAPPSATVPGLGLGAVGLAAKMVVLQIVGVNLQAYAIARGDGPAYEVAHQAVVLPVLVVMAWVCKWIAGAVLGGGVGPWVEAWAMVLASLLYAAGSLGLVCGIPTLAGLNRGQIRLAVSGSMRRLRLLGA